MRLKEKKKFISPLWGNGIFSIWRRNFLYFRKSLPFSFLWTILEPLIYLLAIGYGLGKSIGKIEGMSYASYFAPALIAISGMFIAFFESTEGCFKKLYQQKTYHTIFLTPISVLEITLAEILWGTTKAFLSLFVIFSIVYLQGLIVLSKALPSLCLLFLLCWIFSAFGLGLTTYFFKNKSRFISIYSGFLLPLAFFSETYFPLSHWPNWIQILSYFFPLSHVMLPLREGLTKGELPQTFYFHVALLLIFAVTLTVIAVKGMKHQMKD